MLVGPAALPNTETAMLDLFRGLKVDPNNVVDAQILPPDANGQQVLRFMTRSNMAASDIPDAGTNLIAAGVPLRLVGVLPLVSP